MHTENTFIYKLKNVLLFLNQKHTTLQTKQGKDFVLELAGMILIVSLDFNVFKSQIAMYYLCTYQGAMLPRQETTSATSLRHFQE